MTRMTTTTPERGTRRCRCPMRRRWLRPATPRALACGMDRCPVGGATSTGSWVGRPGGVYPTAVAVPLPAPAVAIMHRGGETCAAVNDKRLRCWGQSDDTPVYARSSIIAVPPSAHGHTCSVQDSGYVTCSGGADYGQLGAEAKLPSPRALSKSAKGASLLGLIGRRVGRNRPPLSGEERRWGEEPNLGGGERCGELCPHRLGRLVLGRHRRAKANLRTAEGEARVRWRIH